MPTLSDFSARAITGAELPLSRYAGQVVLVVNTASQCGFTPQYEGLERLHTTYAAQGLVVLGFPCDQFGHQEPGDDATIADFCELNFGVTFPLFSKVEVNGDGAHPVYQRLTETPDASGESGPVQWNFEKFLVDGDGAVVARFRPMTDPGAPEVRTAIEALLPR